jgi:hypothetical protein
LLATQSSNKEESAEATMTVEQVK